MGVDAVVCVWVCRVVGEVKEGCHANAKARELENAGAEERVEVVPSGEGEGGGVPPGGVAPGNVGGSGLEIGEFLGEGLKLGFDCLSYVSFDSALGLYFLSGDFW